ncbi:NAC domain containing protein [Parasponia andersonii]|uniref:NAC domain containing protein n=1 Tax=Parasponia andersonii TaxID=3476 RepID=A0A2P5CNR4_PARAD|nr:NAC domain containing protein [Parasponia andersonii]
MGLRDIGATLPPGFRFYPSDEELVCHYLYKKICNEEALKGTLVEIDLHTCEPWQLPDVAKLNANEWYFFSFRDRKYATGYRTNRATTSGYWKATGKDRTVVDPMTKEIVGMRKTLVFYRNRAPNGIKTGWIMHEFRLETPHMPPKEDWVLCRVFHKSKSESNTEVSNQQLNNNNNLVSSPPSDNHHQTMGNYGSYDQRASFSSTPTNHSANAMMIINRLHHHEFSSDPTLMMGTSSTGTNTEISSSRNCSNDDYGFLWDMNFDHENRLENDHQGMPSVNFDEMRSFEMDNSMAFL